MTTSTLHTVSKSPFQSNLLADCLNVAQASQSIVLLEDGVYGVLASSPTNEKLAEFINAGGHVFALDIDLAARGISTQYDKITPLDYNRFVELCTQHNPIQSWY
ncbi:hypothetical protein R50073_24700 [Maricurvus nonylphenolicus]|uniref:sulfurtransferase complex subunit TusB n=1 Tax=Maricurvus nonylphenolicus TaxID=1008307 RepID=UPI0036F23DE7